MKNLHYIFSAIIGLILLGISSCETEEVQPPALPAKQAQQADLAGNKIFKKYYLSAFDDYKIGYNASFQLKKVELSSNYYREYKWHQQNGSPYLTVTHYYNGYLHRRYKYLLNSQGQCQTFTLKLYETDGEASATYVKNFAYYPNGKLKEFYNPAEPKAKITFTYDAAGDLTQIMHHNSMGVAYAQQEFGYTNQEISTKKLDLYHFNPDVPGIDFYPKIFGTFTNHLPMTYKHAPLTNNEPAKNYLFRYQLNPDGFPIKRQLINLTDHSVKSSHDFHYQIRIFGAKQ